MENTKKIALFKNDKEYALQCENGVPLNYVFGNGIVKNTHSFGNSSLQENAKKADVAFKNTEYLQSIWNHTHTQWMWKHLNMNYHSPFMNMRQVAAELSAKKAALDEAKWGYVENELKIKKLEIELSSDKVEQFRQTEIKVEILKLKESMTQNIRYVEGAMKDVIALGNIYDELILITKDFTEADIEKEETKSHLKRALVQSIRDVRQFGSITKGEQEYLENIGVNPMKVQMIMLDYVKTEANSDDWGVSNLHEFVDMLTDKLVTVCKVDQVKMRLQGFTSKTNDECSFLGKE